MNRDYIPKVGDLLSYGQDIYRVVKVLDDWRVDVNHEYRIVNKKPAKGSGNTFTNINAYLFESLVKMSAKVV